MVYIMNKKLQNNIDIVIKYVCSPLVEDESEAPRACCKAFTAECLACTVGQTAYEYCRRYPQTVGCQGIVLLSSPCPTS